MALIQIRIWILPQVVHILENQNYFFTFIQSNASLIVLSFSSVSAKGVIIFNILNSLLKCSEKKYSLALQFDEMGTGPDRQALDSIPIRILQIDADQPDPDLQHLCQTNSWRIPP